MPPADWKAAPCISQTQVSPLACRHRKSPLQDTTKGMTMARLDGKVAWVTGAASGIGLACCERFAAEGAVVVGSDISTMDGFPGVELLQVDVRDEAAQMGAVEKIVADHGRLAPG